MKTLLISCMTGGDWSLDLLFAGLVKNLGIDDVIDFPPKEIYRKLMPLVRTGDPESDWGAERASLGYTEYNRNARRYTKQDVMQLLAAGEVGRIFLDERQESLDIYRSLQAQMYKVPVVIVAGHDRLWRASADETICQYGQNFEAMFTDNVPPDEGRRVFLYNWSANFDHLWDHTNRHHLLSKKVYDLCFMGYNSHGSRARYVDHIMKRWSHLNNTIMLERRPDTFSSFVLKNEFFSIMAQSKICINLKGAAENGKALRFWEIPYVGSCMLSENFSMQQLHPFVGGQHCIYFDGVDTLDESIDFLLKHEEVRESLASSGHENIQWHTPELRVKEMLKRLAA